MVHLITRIMLIVLKLRLNLANLFFVLHFIVLENKNLILKNTNVRLDYLQICVLLTDANTIYNLIVLFPRLVSTVVETQTRELNRCVGDVTQTYYHLKLYRILFHESIPNLRTAMVAQGVRALASHAEGWVFESQPQQTYVVFKAPLPNAR